MLAAQALKIAGIQTPVGQFKVLKRAKRINNTLLFVAQDCVFLGQIQDYALIFFDRISSSSRFLFFIFQLADLFNDYLPCFTVFIGFKQTAVRTGILKLTLQFGPLLLTFLTIIDQFLQTIVFTGDLFDAIAVIALVLLAQLKRARQLLVFFLIKGKADIQHV